MDEIAEILLSLSDKKDVAVFLKQILTPTEQKMIERRWELVKLLDQGIPQREIASKLGMSLCKVTRGARELKKTDSIFRKILVKQD